MPTVESKPTAKKEIRKRAAEKSRESAKKNKAAAAVVEDKEEKDPIARMSDDLREKYKALSPLSMNELESQIISPLSKTKSPLFLYKMAAFLPASQKVRDLQRINAKKFPEELLADINCEPLISGTPSERLAYIYTILKPKEKGVLQSKYFTLKGVGVLSFNELVSKEIKDAKIESRFLMKPDHWVRVGDFLYGIKSNYALGEQVSMGDLSRAFSNAMLGCGVIRPTDMAYEKVHPNVEISGAKMKSLEILPEDLPHIGELEWDAICVGHKGSGTASIGKSDPHLIMPDELLEKQKQKGS